MTSLDIDHRGCFTLAIEAADGEVHPYRLARVLPGLDEWAMEVTGGQEGHTYRVGMDRRGIWRCSCPDYKYRGRQKLGCKHSEAVKALKGALDELIRTRTRKASIGGAA
jgi:hypothetical protein